MEQLVEDRYTRGWNKLKEIEDQAFQLRFRLSMGQTEGLKKIREMRKDKARLLTYLRAKELQGAK